MATRTIEGLDKCLRDLDKAPAEVVEATKKSLQSASRATVRVMRTRVPSRWAALLKYKVSKLQDGSLNACYGLFNNHQATGSNPDAWDWFKAYWNNYGTLEGRDPSHRFERPVKPAKQAAARNRRNRKGIHHQNFFEDAARGSEQTFMTAFEAALDKNTENIL